MSFSDESITETSEPQLTYRPEDKLFVQRASWDFGTLSVSSSSEIEIEFTAVVVPSANQGKGPFHLPQQNSSPV